MLNLGIISKLGQNTATPWMNSFVLVKKPNGSLSVCLDPTDLNKSIVHPVCNMCTLDERNHLLKETKFFSVFDTTKGFFQILLDADSLLLTAIVTPFGIYIFNILLMGLRNLGILFEFSLCSCISDLPGCTNIVDDILIFGRTQEEHYSNVIQFLEHCLVMNIKLNPEKSQINCKEVP